MHTKEEILAKKNWSTEYPNYMAENEIHDAMDEYGKSMCLDLLHYMGINNVDCSCDNKAAEITQEQMFYYKGEWITAEQLFNNFL